MSIDMNGNGLISPTDQNSVRIRGFLLLNEMGWVALNRHLSSTCGTRFARLSPWRQLPREKSTKSPLASNLGRQRATWPIPACMPWAMDQASILCSPLPWVPWKRNRATSTLFRGLHWSTLRCPQAPAHTLLDTCHSFDHFELHLRGRYYTRMKISSMESETFMCLFTEFIKIFACRYSIVINWNFKLQFGNGLDIFNVWGSSMHNKGRKK